jgi:hypothetical protein
MICEIYLIVVVLGCVVVSVLASGPKVRRFKLGLGRWILRAMNVRSTPSFNLRPAC